MQLHLLRTQFKSRYLEDAKLVLFIFETMNRLRLHPGYADIDTNGIQYTNNRKPSTTLSLART